MSLSGCPLAASTSRNESTLVESESHETAPFPFPLVATVPFARPTPLLFDDFGDPLPLVTQLPFGMDTGTDPFPLVVPFPLPLLFSESYHLSVCLLVDLFMEKMLWEEDALDPLRLEDDVAPRRNEPLAAARWVEDDDDGRLVSPRSDEDEEDTVRA